MNAKIQRPKASPKASSKRLALFLVQSGAIFFCVVLNTAGFIRITHAQNSHEVAQAVETSDTRQQKQTHPGQLFTAGTPEDDETCRLVIDILIQNRQDIAVSRLQADLDAEVFSEYAINLTINSRLRKHLKIRVPIGPNRYRVWYGYSTAIRTAVLATAAANAPTDHISKSRIKQVGFQEALDESTENAGGKYPTRKSWWTLGKRYPDKPTMIQHLSSVKHEGKFSTTWLESLSREELHALHSDDHEDKVNWEFAVPQEPADSDTQTENL